MTLRLCDLRWWLLMLVLVRRMRMLLPLLLALGWTRWIRTGRWHRLLVLVLLLLMMLVLLLLLIA